MRWVEAVILFVFGLLLFALLLRPEHDAVSAGCLSPPELDSLQQLHHDLRHWIGLP